MCRRWRWILAVGSVGLVGCQCYATDGGSERDAAGGPRDAGRDAQAHDAEPAPDARVVWYCPSATGDPGCEPQVRFCCEINLESEPECRAEPYGEAGEGCVESLVPGESEAFDCHDGTADCPTERPFCCIEPTGTGLRACSDHELLSWRCSP